MSTSTPTSDGLSWTALGVRMGFTRDRSQREDILEAIDHMAWTQTATHPPCLGGQAVRAIVSAVCRYHRNQLRLIGVARLDGTRQLLGLEDSSGIRRYLLDLDSEAIYVLADFPPAVNRAQHADVA